MRNLFPVLLALTGLSAATLAQDVSPSSGAAKSKAAVAKPAEKPTFVPTPAPPAEAAPEAKSPGVLQRIFGSRQGKRTLFPTTPAPESAKATPKPAATTAPAVKKRKPKPKPAAEETEETAGKTAPESTPPKPETTEPTTKPEVAPPATTKKTTKGKGKTAAVVAAPTGNEPPADADPETKEKFRFDQAKAKAAEDPEVMELKAKADGAISDEEARSAQRAYNKALFSKMRKIDSSLDERTRQMEAAILKRLDEK